MKTTHREIDAYKNNKYLYDKNIKIKAFIYGEDTDFGYIHIINVTALDYTYDLNNPEYYEIKFNCDHLKTEKDQDWMAYVLASDLVKVINDVREKHTWFITKKIKDLLRILKIDIKGLLTGGD